MLYNLQHNNKVLISTSPTNSESIYVKALAESPAFQTWEGRPALQKICTVLQQCNSPPPLQPLPSPPPLSMLLQRRMQQKPRGLYTSPPSSFLCIYLFINLYIFRFKLFPLHISYIHLTNIFEHYMSYIHILI